MSALPELQRAVAAAVFAGSDATTALAAHCAGDPAAIAAGLRAYRRNVIGTLSAAVIASYPVVGRIVGERFLAAAARAYAQDVPSTQGDLNAYGDAFDRFLEGFEPARGLPYLPAVAHLEWCVQELRAAAETAPRDLAPLAAIAPQDWGALRFMLDPAHALLHSRWPLARIWQINQPGYEGSFELDPDGAECVLLHRRDTRVAVEAIGRGEFQLLRALGNGHTLEAAADTALAADPAFDLSTVLARRLHDGLVIRIHLPTEPPQ